MSNGIDFLSYLGPCCPLCGEPDCYRQITPYWRYAIELFPEFQKEPIPIARFFCRKRRRTFSLLPIQLIPYFQYTVSAVIGTLLLALAWQQQGRQGFWDASVRVAPDSGVTPWLVASWRRVVLRGLGRAHAVLRRWYDLSRIRSPLWEELSGYLGAFGLKRAFPWPSGLSALVDRYSRATRAFLFGTPSHLRVETGSC